MFLVNEEQKEVDIPLSSLIYLKKIGLRTILFNIKSLLGQGQFGNVYLVEDLQGKRYALKTVSKARVFSLCLEKHVQV